MPKFDILGVQVSAINIEEGCFLIDSFIVHKTKTYVCVAPVSTIVECQNNPKYKEVINQAGIVTPDGIPVVWLGRSAGYSNVRRTYGPDLMLAVCDKGQEKGYRHFLYGATPKTLELLEENLKKKFPAINIVGKYAPPFRQEIFEEYDILNRINNSGADLLWVAIGAPKQDFWMYKYRSELNVPVMLGVGAAFDFIAGTKPQAPLWMQRSGLEWFFRLCCEPKRLWKRYLLGNTQFVYLLSKDLFRKTCRQ